MKKVFLFLAVAGTVLLGSCSDDDSSSTPVKVTSIVLTPSVTTVQVGTPVTFTVKDNLGADVTSTSAILVGTTAIASNVWTPTAAGTFIVKATNGTLTSADVTITVTAAPVTENPTPNDSFVIGADEFSTPTALFAYRGVFEFSDSPGNYYVIFEFNPFLEVGTGADVTYPNDLYLTLAYVIVPTGTNAETGEPEFDVEAAFPTAANFTLGTTVPGLVGFSATADGTELDSDVATATLNLTTVQYATSEDVDNSNMVATYAVTLEDGTIINGEYSGTTGVYNGAATSKGVKTIKGAKLISAKSAKKVSFVKK